MFFLQTIKKKRKKNRRKTNCKLVSIDVNFVLQSLNRRRQVEVEVQEVQERRAEWVL